MRNSFTVTLSFVETDMESRGIMRDAVQQAAREVLTTAVLLGGNKPKVGISYYSNGTGTIAVPLAGPQHPLEQDEMAMEAVQ